MFDGLFTRFAAACAAPKSSLFFGVPHWYQYLKLSPDPLDSSKCVPNVTSLNQILPIGLAVVDILLYIAGILVVGYVIYGGFLYMTSQGEGERLAGAKNTIINASVGLVIVFLAITIINFIGATFK